MLAPLPAGLVVLPEEPLAASFMHCSFSVPVSCAHFASPAPALPLAPVVVEVLDWPVVLPLAEAPESAGLSLLVLAPAVAEPLAEVEGVVEVDGVLCELVLPLAAPCSRRQRSFSAAIMLSQLLLAMLPAAVPAGPLVCAPVVPDEVWAKEALDSARSAAAVALASTFRFIWMLLWRNGWSERQRRRRKRRAGHRGATAPEGPLSSRRGISDPARMRVPGPSAKLEAAARRALSASSRPLRG